MKRYAGKVCPFCRTAIKSCDDIVVCNICGMPHHKDCWIDNQGCTTFGCTGTISAPGEQGMELEENESELDLCDEIVAMAERLRSSPARP